MIMTPQGGAGGLKQEQDEVKKQKAVTRVAGLKAAG